MAITIASAATVAWDIKFNDDHLILAQQSNTAYEQQGVAAVRSVKPAVVNITGNSGAEDGSVTTISGSGFVIDPNGYIVSNNHVVQDPGVKYSVMFADGSQYDARIVGQDKYNDIALLKIDATGLPVARLGDSSALESGQTVFVIGNSLGKYPDTVTRGVISGLDRSVEVGTDSEGPTMPRLQDLIQTDAPINTGNSGGPVIDLNGEVVGMSTLIDTGGEGLGFAVSSNTIKNSIDQLRQTGSVAKPYLGIKFATINKAVQELRNLPVSEGAYIDSVEQGSPAEQAGLKKGDIVTAIDGEKLTPVNELDQVVNNFAPDAQITLTVLRDGKEQSVPVTLGKFGE